MGITSSAFLPHPLLVAGASAVGISAWLLVQQSRRLPFPPGPSPDPVIGNLRHMGSGNLEFLFAKWGKEYGELFSWRSRGNRIQSPNPPVTGPVSHVSVFGRHLVILNSFDDAHELLDNRGGIYSSRPRLVTLSEMHAGSPCSSSARQQHLRNS